MKCEKCKKDFAAGVKAAYKLGLNERTARLVQAYNKVCTTNRVLLDHLFLMDEIEPLDANTVRLSKKQVEGIINALRKKGNFYQARKLKKIMESQIGATGSPESKLREILETIEDDK